MKVLSLLAPGAIGLTALSSAGLPIAAQDRNPPPQFRAGVEVVLLDVSVLDRNRVPVRNLQVSDFTVLEDANPRRIVSFNEVSVPEPDGALVPWMREVSPDVRTNLRVRIDPSQTEKTDTKAWKVPWSGLSLPPPDSNLSPGSYLLAFEGRDTAHSASRHVDSRSDESPEPPDLTSSPRRAICRAPTWKAEDPELVGGHELPIRPESRTGASGSRIRLRRVEENT